MYTCVKGKKLTRKNRTITHSNTEYHVYQANSRDCHSCPLWNKCTSAKNGRAIKIPQKQEFRKKYTDRMNHPENRKLIKERKNLIEHVFGTLKRWMGKLPILLTSQKKGQIEIDLYTTVYNIRRLVSMEDVPVLVQKLRNYSF
ncbi:MAG: transposase [Tannerellaceae bacterium]|nr:transposase [Tannerellaceae bacterium]